jgi:hypothetical protein
MLNNQHKFPIERYMVYAWFQGVHIPGDVFVEGAVFADEMQHSAHDGSLALPEIPPIPFEYLWEEEGLRSTRNEK